MTTPNKDDDATERVEWLIRTTNDSGEWDSRPAADALRRRDLRERRRGMALAALRIAHRDGEECQDNRPSGEVCGVCEAIGRLAYFAGPAAMRWARKQQT